MNRHVGAGRVQQSGSLSSEVVGDASLQAAMQPWIEMECYQLSGGDRLSKVDALDLGHQQIVRERQMAAIQKLGIMPADRCTLSYCSESQDFRFSELGGGAAEAVFFMPAHTEFDIYVPCGAQTAYVSFDQNAFLAAAAALSPELWDRDVTSLQQLPTAQRFALKPVLDQWLAVAGKVVAAEGGLRETLLLHHIAQAVTVVRDDAVLAAPSIERARAYSVCRTARAYVEECFAADCVPTVVDICRAVGVSERSLQYAFQAYVDMSPLSYLRLCRLNRVRAVLREASVEATTVTAIAMRFGFLHLGRFAIDYKRLFGQSPSVTLAS